MSNSITACSVKIFKPTFQYFVYICHCICDNFATPAAQKANDLKSLLLGSMYFWSWLIQLNKSYKHNDCIKRTSAHLILKCFALFGKVFFFTQSKATQNWSNIKNTLTLSPT